MSHAYACISVGWVWLLSHIVSSAFQGDHHEPTIQLPPCPDQCGDTLELTFVQNVSYVSPVILSPGERAKIIGNEQSTILALNIAFPIVSTLAVILRFEARRVKRIHLGADDWTILVALVYSKIRRLSRVSAKQNTS